MISITNVMQYVSKHRRTLSFQWRTGLLIPGFSPRWHEKRETILRNYMLTIPYWPQPNTRCILWCLRSQFITGGRDLKNSTACLNGRKPNYIFQRSKSNWRLFKILKFSGPSLLGMTSSTFQPNFLSGSLWWQTVIVISFAREH